MLRLFDSVMSNDVTMQYGLLSSGIAMVILSAMKVVSEDAGMHVKLSEHCRLHLISKISDVIVDGDNMKVQYYGTLKA